MPTYRFVWPTHYACHMTVPQYDRACEIARDFNLPHNVVVQPVFMLNDAVMIDVGSMKIVVLPDGSSHS